jgi:hypothetical protein
MEENVIGSMLGQMVGSLLLVLPIVISILAFLVSFGSFWLQRKSVKGNTLSQIFSNISSVNNGIEELSEKMAALHLNGNRTIEQSLLLEGMQVSLRLKVNSLLFVYEFACLQFYSKQVNKSDFKALLHDQLLELYNNHHQDYIVGREGQYGTIVRYFEDNG